MHTKPEEPCNVNEGLQAQWQYMVLQENAMLRNTVAQLHAMLIARDLQNKELQVEFDRLLNDFKDHMSRHGEPIASDCVGHGSSERLVCDLEGVNLKLKSDVMERDQEIDNLSR